MEFEIVKQHPQHGHDIVAGVGFPWPVGQMILQHHERLDGSGYPARLVWRTNLPGAQIIAVADVVEAMSSHRPYRPALGTELAVKEIERQRGQQLDADAVDACLRLFREQGFDLGAEQQTDDKNLRAARHLPARLLANTDGHDPWSWSQNKKVQLASTCVLPQDEPSRTARATTARRRPQPGRRQDDGQRLTCWPTLPVAQLLRGGSPGRVPVASCG